MRPLALAFAGALLVLTACDSAVSPPEAVPPEAAPNPTAPLRSYEGSAAFGRYGDPAVENPFGVALMADGSLQKTSETGATFGGYLAGLWLGGQQGGTTRANLVWYPQVHNGGNQAQSNYSVQCPGSGALFALHADTTYTDTGAWPRSLGAPVATDGSPHVYGDRMVWGSFCPVSNPDASYFTAPFDGLRINTAVFAHDRQDLRDVRFVRYEVTNTGSAPITDLRVGYFSDTDSPSAAADAVAFDATSGLSYVYNLAKRADGDYFTSWVSGFAFLDTPKDAPLLAHRIMRKNHYYDPEFGETGVESPHQLIYALDGLSNDGEPMIDPTTGATTRFAFTGDPFAGLGWRDGLFNSGSYSGVDVRHLTSTGPISLAPGETVAFTVVWVTAVESSPGASQFAVSQTLAAVRAEPALWQF